MNNTKNILLRILAVFGASGLGVIGAGSIIIDSLEVMI